MPGVAEHVPGASTPPVLSELGFYTLAGAPRSPRELIEEVRLGEEMGLGTAFISERFTFKEAATLSGAAGAVSERIGIATAATNHNTRDPLITASYATTMHRLTGGRFTLGLGRGVRALYDAVGWAPVTTSQLEDFAGLMRRLWNGERVEGHDGPAGRFGTLQLDPSFREDISLGLVAFGPNTLALAGRAFDMVVLHTYFTDETLERAVRTVKQAAEQAGRDPASVQVWSCLATVGDHLPESVQLKKTVGRLATYLQYYGDLMVRTNGWDPALLDRFRESEPVRSMNGPIDGVATTEQLEQIAEYVPTEWLAAAATGSPASCVHTVRSQFDYGADGVILHGAGPAELSPIVEEYRARFGSVAPSTWKENFPCVSPN